MSAPTIEPSDAHLTENKVAVALAVRAAMREHRKGAPMAFSWPGRWPR